MVPAGCPESAEQLGRAGIEIREERIVRLEGSDGKLDRIVFDEGRAASRDGRSLSARASISEATWPAKLGCRFTEKGAVDTGFCEATNVPGLYVAGDAPRTPSS